MKDEDLFDCLLEAEGMEDEFQFIAAYGNESSVPGICTKTGCHFTANVEPDQTEGWCEICEAPTVKSGLILLGII